MSIILKSIILNMAFFIILLTLLHSQKTFSMTFVHPNNTNNTILPGYIECFLDYKTSRCDECPPGCLSDNSSYIVVENKKLARDIDQVFEKTLRQISNVKSGVDKNDTYTAGIYLRSLLIKHQIKISELTLIDKIIEDIQAADSIVSLGNNVHEKLKILTSDKNSSPVAISIVNITSKSIDLLISSNDILSSIQEDTNLMNDLATQKKWITEILDNTVVGCDVSGISGCLTASIFSAGIS